MNIKNQIRFNFLGFTVLITLMERNDVFYNVVVARDDKLVCRF